MTFNELNRAEKVARLQAHIQAVAEKPCVWGVDDCSAWSGAWVEKERGVSLGLPVYRGEEQGRALIEKAGGLVNIWHRLAMIAGVPETDYPAFGDVGLIETRMGPVGVIVADGGVCAWRAAHGVTFIRPRTFLKAWAI